MAVWISPAVLKSEAAQNTEKPLSANTMCSVEEPEWDMATDGHALTEYKRWVSQLLKEEKFDQLECIAQAARKNKTRFSGGEWKLHKFYVGLQEPNPDMHATEEDWQQHLARVQKWVDAKPRSLTPRIALAASYEQYGWYARGTGMSDSVSNSGWKLLEDRAMKAETILKEASKMPDTDPEWYVVKQHVALAEQWPKERALALFQEAVAFEPGYFYYHRILANFLLPNWNGEAGEASAFVKASADKLTGPEGDAMYFLIAADVVCTCDEPEFNRLSWPRLQNGFKDVEKEYGVSMHNLNFLALMAARFEDPVVAADAFHRIGDNWDLDTWHAEGYFQQNKQWAEQVGPMINASQQAAKQAIANASTEPGMQYQKAVQQAFAGPLSKCSDVAKNVRNKFNLILQVGQKGAIEFLYTGSDAPGQLVNCLMTKVIEAKMPLPVPPSSPYFVTIELDPSQIQASAR